MSAAATVVGVDPTVYERRWKILGVLCLSLIVIMVANSSLNTALPALADDLHASSSALQWMVDSYSLVFAGLLFTAGTLGDRFGRKRALQFGMTVFLVAAIAASLSNSAGGVIAWRAVMGLGAAFVMPSTLSLLTNVFPPHERPRAIATWAGVAGGGAAFGPPLSGFLVEHFWWGSVFLINVPLLVIALVAGRFMLPESADPEQANVDVGGAALSIVAIGLAVFAIIEAPTHGWLSATTLGTLGGAAVATLAFMAWERRRAYPMFDMALLRDRRFAIAGAVIALCFFAMFGVMFVMTQYLQLVLRYSAFGAGLLMLPMPMLMMIVAPQAPKLAGRFGVARTVPIGLGLVAVGLMALTILDARSPGWMLYLGMIPMMVGMASTMSPCTALIMSSVPATRAGMGSAANDTTRELGGALGVAVLGSVLATQFKSGLDVTAVPAAAKGLAESGLAGALRVAAQLPQGAGAALARGARGSYVDGMHVASIVGAVVVAVTAAVAAVLLRRLPASAMRLARHIADEPAAGLGDDISAGVPAG